MFTDIKCHHHLRTVDGGNGCIFHTKGYANGLKMHGFYLWPGLARIHYWRKRNL